MSESVLEVAEALTPELIDSCRVNPTQAMIYRQQLTELALDGLRFRAWCEGATPGGGVCTMASLLAKCITPQQYREAIDNFIVLRAKGQVQKP